MVDIRPLVVNTDLMWSREGHLIYLSIETGNSLQS